MAIHCSTLAWESTWTEKPGRLQSSELQSQTRLKRVSTQHTHTDVTYKSEVIRTWREHWRWGWGKSRSERWFPNEVLLFSRSVVSDSLPPKGLQQARLPCQSSSPGACSHSCPLSRWCHPTTSSPDVPFYSCLQPCPASGSFPMSQFFALGGQSTGVWGLASVLAVTIHDWLPLWLTASKWPHG